MTDSELDSALTQTSEVASSAAVDFPVEAIASPMIMIVDDHPTNVKLLFNLLQESGYRVLVAQGGESALVKLQAVTPDLILLDVMMPKLNGFEVCQQLKASPTTQSIPIIFMTALSDEVDKVNGLSIGAVDYITKPFQHGDVLARVSLHLQLAHLTRTLEQRVTERTEALTQTLEQLKASQLQLIQSEKMSALGQFTAGIAHEINNPLNFIQNNLPHIKTYTEALIRHVRMVHQEVSRPEIEAHAAAIDLEYLLEDLPNAIDSLHRGAERIHAISASLRGFVRSDDCVRDQLNLHEGIDSTLILVAHRLKATLHRPSIEVVKDYGSLPAVTCISGQINQVIMNVLANAIDALDEMSQLGQTNDHHSPVLYQITLCTRLLCPDFTSAEAGSGGREPKTFSPPTLHPTPSSWVELRISDSGRGIPENIRPRIFDYLFTTKPVGQGTGLGLAIAYQIVTQNHGGTIKVNSALGEGAEFVICLPVSPPEPEDRT